MWENSPNYLCHFWNHQPFFKTQLVSIFFSSNITYFLQKRSQSNCRFSDFQLLRFKFTKFLISFFKQKVIFLKVWIFFQCHERWFFCNILAETLHAIDKSSTSKCKFSDLPQLALKFTKFLMSILEPRVSFSSNDASLFRVMWHNSSVLFHLNLYMLWTKEAHQSANFETFDYLTEN